MLTALYLCEGHAQATDSVWAQQLLDSVNRTARRAQIEQAEAYLDPAMETFRQHELWWAYANSLSLKAGFARKRSEFDIAISYLDSSIAISKKHLPETHTTNSLLHNNMGIYHATITKDLSLANYHFKKALHSQIANVGENNRLVSHFYNNLGNVTMSMGDTESALVYKQKALEINQRLTSPDHPSMGVFTNNLGFLYLRLGDFTEALRMFRRAVSLRINAPEYGPDHPSMGLYTYNLAETFYNLGMQDSAAFYAEITLQNRLKGNEQNRIADAYHMQSLIAEGNKDIAKALALNQKAERLYASYFGSEHPYVFHMKDSRRNILKKNGNFREALTLAYDIQKFKTSLLDNNYLFENYSYIIADLHFQLKEWTQALEMSNNAQKEIFPDFIPDNILSIPDNFEKPYSEDIDFLRLKAKILFYSDNISLDRIEVLRSVIQHSKVADSLLKEHLTLYKWEDSKENLLAILIPIYETGIMACKELTTLTGDSKSNADALYFAEAFRANSLRNSLAELRAKAFAGLPESVLAKEKQLKTELDFFERKLSASRNTAPQQGSNPGYWETKVFKLQYSLDSLKSEMEKNHPNYYQLKFSNSIPSLAAIQKELQDQEKIIQYFWGEQSIFVFKINHDEVSLRQIETKPDALKKQVEHFLENLKTGISEKIPKERMVSFAKNSHTLYAILIEPELSSTTDQIIVIPDGILGHLPFDILITDPPSDHIDMAWGDLNYLIKSHTIRYGFASRLSAYTPLKNIRPTHLVAAFAPHFDAGQLAENTNIRRGGNEIEFGPLTQNEAEATEIGELLSGRVFVNTDATEENFKQFASQYQILHLASHAFVDDENPRFSGLIFTLPQQNIVHLPDSLSGFPEDGVLSVDEIFNLSLNADLTVLSACNTGVGKYVRGEGLMSLARAFRYAGCPNIATSLWEANDYSTREIMRTFYFHLKEGKGKADALRLAKLQYLDKHRKSHPFYWAGFILIGDNAPVTHNGFPPIWMWGLGLLLIVLAVGIYRHFTQR